MQNNGRNRNNNNNFGYNQNQNNFLNQQPLRTQLPGRFITSLNELRPQDVPMNGDSAFFPQENGNVIYEKFWDDNCELKTVKYVRSNEPIEPEPAPEDPIEVLSKRINTLDDGFNKVLTSLENLMNAMNTNAPQTAGDYYGSTENKEAKS